MECKLKKIRESVGLTQIQVSQLIGIPVKTIQNWEQGTRNPSQWVLNLVINRLLQITLKEEFQYDQKIFDLQNDNIIIKLNYKKWISNLPVGYSSHKLILDENGTAINYNFIDANHLFEQYTGLRITEVVGKTVLEVLPDIFESDFDWLGYYANIAMNDKTGEFIAYSKPLKRSYKVKVFSPDYLYFVVFFSEC